MAKKSKIVKQTRGHIKKKKQVSVLRGVSSQKYFLQQAISLHQAGHLPQAESLYRQILSVEPNHPQALNFLGILAHQLGKNKIGAELIGKALSHSPDYAQAHNNLGIILNDQGKLEDAVTSYSRALALKSDYAEAYNNLGNTLRDQGKLREAFTSFQQALSLKPDFVEAYYNLGNVLGDQGKFDEAEIFLKKALSINPDYVRAFCSLSTIVKFTEVDDVIREMEDLYISKKELSDSDRIHLGFALGKVFEDLGDYDKSFSYILAANSLKRGSYEYSIQNDHVYIEKIKKTFVPDFFLSHHGLGNKDRTPIFILGMPRSGTTLVEQILASHPLVFGAGELLLLNSLIKDICTGPPTVCFPDCMLDLRSETFERMGLSYIEKIREYSSDAKYITDKMPHNFLYIGLIKIILPDAKIIHCTRNPMDNCYSIFKNHFSAHHEYAYDMAELGQYYNLYRDLMNHWEKVLPGFIYSLKYEELVTNQKHETKSLLDFCNLPWNESCLSFHKTKRVIITSSLKQVRQHINKDSVELWKKYEKQLEPLRKEIYG